MLKERIGLAIKSMDTKSKVAAGIGCSVALLALSAPMRQPRPAAAPSVNPSPQTEQLPNVPTLTGDVTTVWNEGDTVRPGYDVEIRELPHEIMVSYKVDFLFPGDRQVKEFSERFNLLTREWTQTDRLLESDRESNQPYIGKWSKPFEMGVFDVEKLPSGETIIRADGADNGQVWVTPDTGEVTGDDIVVVRYQAKP